MKHSNQSSSAPPANDDHQSAQLLVEALGQLDLSALKNATSSIPAASNSVVLSASSYDRLHEIAQTIIGLNVAKDFPTKDRDESDATLTKLLQICQTIIDFLLADGKQQHAPVASKNDINSYNNNLRQENAKLRKLLSLQQKAIAFRRANLWSGNNSSQVVCNSVANETNGEEDDVTTSAAVENLPEDSQSVNTSSAKSPSGLQCVYCPKIFSDSSSFAKHLSLRHFSSSIDDGLPPSISSSGSTFMQRLQLQYQKTTAQQKNLVAIEISQQNQSVIDRLQEEITELKSKLTQTEQALDEEKSARQSFENDFKNGIALNIQQIQEQLMEKIEEIKFLRNEAQIAADQAANANRTCNELVNKLNVTEEVATESRSIPLLSRQKNDRLSEMQSHIAQKIEAQMKRQLNSEIEQISPEENNLHVDTKSKIDKPVDHNTAEPLDSIDLKDDQSEAQSKVIESTANVGDNEPEPSSIPTATQLKQSLRLQLISQLTTKRSERQVQESNDTVQQQEEAKKEKERLKKKKLNFKAKKSPSYDNQPVSKSCSDALDNQELTKAEIHLSIESRLREYLQTASVDIADSDVNSVAINGQIEESTDQQNSPFLDESKFTAAMNKVQRDRNLVIHQSRYDYDFVQIESTLRDLIDSKVRSKLSEWKPIEEPKPTEDEVAQVYSMNEPIESLATEDSQPEEEEKTIDSVLEISNGVTEDIDSKIEDNAQPLPPTASPEEPEQSSLKSILKTRKGNRPQTRRKSFDFESSADEQRTPGRRISFSSQIIEFPISPRESSEDSDVDDDEELGLAVSSFANNGANNSTIRRNQMFVIRSMDDNDDDDEPALEQPPADSFGGEKIFINEYSSSSSSSSDDELQPMVVARHDLSSLRPSSSHQVVDVEVHQQSPTPAQRKSRTSNTLNSLLMGDDLSPGQESKQTTQTTRVQELADLIERKLQQKSVDKSADVKSTEQGSRPPLGAVDTLAALRQSSTSKPASNNVDDYDIYDF